MPVAGGAAPSQREHAVDDFKSFVVGAVAQCGQIGDEADEPEEGGNCGVGGDGENVPHERAAELRPYAHGVGDGKEPVSEPGTADVDGGENSGGGDRDQGHGLGEAVDGIAPALAE